MLFFFAVCIVLVFVVFGSVLLYFWSCFIRFGDSVLAIFGGFERLAVDISRLITGLSGLGGTKRNFLLVFPRLR